MEINCGFEIRVRLSTQLNEMNKRADPINHQHFYLANGFSICNKRPTTPSNPSVVTIFSSVGAHQMWSHLRWKLTKPQWPWRFCVRFSVLHPIKFYEMVWIKLLILNWVAPCVSMAYYLWLVYVHGQITQYSMTWIRAIRSGNSEQSLQHNNQIQFNQNV